MTEEQDVPTMGSADVTSDDKLWGALGYPIVLIAIIMLFVEGKKTRPFIRYHAIQAVALNLVLWIAYFVLSAVTLGVAAVCFPVAWLITLWPAYKAFKGEYMVLPGITNFLKNQGWA